MVGVLAFYSSHGNLRLGPTSFPPSRFPKVDCRSWQGGSTFGRAAFEGGRPGEKLSTARALQWGARRGKASCFNLDEENCHSKCWQILLPKKKTLQFCVRCEYYDTSSNLARSSFMRRMWQLCWAQTPSSNTTSHGALKAGFLNDRRLCKCKLV